MASKPGLYANRQDREEAQGQELMDVARSRALALACSVALDDEADGDTIRRAQLFYDWMSAKFSVPIVYEIEEAKPPQPLDGDVLPFTSKGKNQGH